MAGHTPGIAGREAATVQAARSLFPGTVARLAACVHPKYLDLYCSNTGIIEYNTYSGLPLVRLRLS